MTGRTEKPRMMYQNLDGSIRTYGPLMPLDDEPTAPGPTLAELFAAVMEADDDRPIVDTLAIQRENLVRT